MDPMEREMVDFLNDYEIPFTRPERDHNDPTNLDFYLPEYNLYIEVKQFHSNRISGQLSKAPEDAMVILLQGRNAIKTFKMLIHWIIDAERARDQAAESKFYDR